MKPFVIGLAVAAAFAVASAPAQSQMNQLPGPKASGGVSAKTTPTPPPDTSPPDTSPPDTSPAPMPTRRLHAHEMAHHHHAMHHAHAGERPTTARRQHEDMLTQQLNGQELSRIQPGAGAAPPPPMPAPRPMEPAAAVMGPKPSGGAK